MVLLLRSATLRWRATPRAVARPAPAARARWGGRRGRASADASDAAEPPRRRALVHLDGPATRLGSSGGGRRRPRARWRSPLSARASPSISAGRWGTTGRDASSRRRSSSCSPRRGCPRPWRPPRPRPSGRRGGLTPSIWIRRRLDELGGVRDVSRRRADAGGAPHAPRGVAPDPQSGCPLARPLLRSLETRAAIPPAPRHGLEPDPRNPLACGLAGPCGSSARTDGSASRRRRPATEPVACALRRSTTARGGAWSLPSGPRGTFSLGPATRPTGYST